MIKGIRFAVLGLAGLSFPLFGQQVTPANDFDAAATLALDRPEIFSSVDSSVLVQSLPMVELLDGRLPGSTLLGQMGVAPVANFPVVLMSAVPAQNRGAFPAARRDEKDAKDAPSEIMALRGGPRLYFGGETGVFYGRSIGRHGGDDFGSYIEGSVGNDKFQLSVGASYEESNVRLPRWAR